MNGQIKTNKLQKAIVIMLVATLTFVMTACGGGSDIKSKALAEKINAGDGFHMKYTNMVDGKESGKADVYVKGDKFYLDSDENGEKTTVIIDGDTEYVVDQDAKTYTKAEVSDSDKAIVQGFQQYNTLFEKMTELDDDKFTVETKSIDGVDYETETISDNGQSFSLAYNDDGELAYMLSNDGSTETMLKMEAIDAEVGDSQFEIPSDYKEGSGAATSGATQTIINSKGGYQFKTGEDYNVEKSDQYTYVYLEKMDTIPDYNVLPMVRVSGATVDSKIEDMIDVEKDKYKERMATQPKKVTINLSDRDIEGMEFAYSSDDGKKTIECGHFFELYDDTFYAWNYTQVKGETKSKDAMKAAMDSFEIKSK